MRAKEIRVYPDKVEIKRDVFTVTIKPTEDRDLDGCITRAHELMANAGVAKSDYSLVDQR